MKHKPFVLPAVTAMFVFALCVTLCVPLCVQALEKTPVLYGTVYLKLAEGKRPLIQVKIELREVNADNNRKEAGNLISKTYSDSKGDFAFYGIPQGKYFVTVVRYKTIYPQLQEGKIVKMRLVTVPQSLPPKGLKMNILTVQEGSMGKK